MAYIALTNNVLVRENLKEIFGILTVNGYSLDQLRAINQALDFLINSQITVLDTQVNRLAKQIKDQKEAEANEKLSAGV